MIDNWKLQTSLFEHAVERGLDVIRGRYSFRNTIFEFKLIEQKNGKYPFRGTVKAVSQSGKVMKLQGKAKREVLKSSNATEDSINPSKLNISAMVYSATTNDIDIRAKIAKTAETLYQKYAGILYEDVKTNVTPENITPAVAVSMYGRNYVYYVHGESSDGRLKMILKTLENVCSKLPNRPMVEFTEKKLASFIRTNQIGNASVDELYRFWDFCISENICDGGNPVKKPEKKPRTARSKQLAAMKIDELSEEQLKVFTKSLEKNPSAINVGIALMASGFKPKEIVNMKWKDISINKLSGYVVVDLYLPERAGATHDFKRPLIPQAARIVKAYLKKIKGNYTVAELGELYVVTAKNKKKPVSSAELVQNATRALKQVSVKNAVFAALRDEDRTMAAATRILFNTYERMLHDKCNLALDTGTINYLTAKSFGGDTTSSAYTSFSSLPGIERLYGILKSVDIETEHLDYGAKQEIVEGKCIITCTTKSSKDYSAAKLSVTLPPGAELIIKCEHGVDGRYSSHKLG